MLSKTSSYSSDCTLVLRKLNEKWGAIVKDKKGQLDRFTAHIGRLQGVTVQLEEATGIVGIQEITAALIQSEEAHYAICSLYNNLDAEVEANQESLKSLQTAIKLTSANSTTLDTQVQGLLTEHRQKCAKLKTSVDTHKHSEKKMRDELDSVKLPLTVRSIQNIIAFLQQSAFKLKSQMDDEPLRDDRLLKRLGEVEESVTSFLIYSAMKQGHPRPTLKSLDLASLPEQRVTYELGVHYEGFKNAL